MSALQKYIDQKNRWNAIFKGKQYEVQTAEGRQEVADSLDSDLSPENLTCDGELRGAKLVQKANKLKAAYSELQTLSYKVA